MEQEYYEINKEEAKLLDPNKMSHLILKDGTIVDIIDDPIPKPQVTSCPSCTCKCDQIKTCTCGQQFQGVRKSRAIFRNPGEIVEDRNNYRLYVSGEAEKEEEEEECDSNCECICHRPPPPPPKVVIPPPPPPKPVCKICEEVERKYNPSAQQPLKSTPVMRNLCPECSNCPHRSRENQGNSDNYKYTEIKGTCEHKKRKVQKYV